MRVLGQSVAFADWLAIAAIVSANGVSLGTGTPRVRATTR